MTAATRVLMLLEKRCCRLADHLIATNESNVAVERGASDWAHSTSVPKGVGHAASRNQSA